MGLGGVTEREEKVRRKKRVQGRLTMSNSSKNGDSTAGLNRRSRLVEGVRF
jgi:hypothetical protein